MQLNMDVYNIVYNIIDFTGLFLDAGLIVFLVSHYFSPRFYLKKQSWFYGGSFLTIVFFIYIFGYNKAFYYFVASIFFSALLYSFLFSGAFYQKLTLCCIYCSLSFIWDSIYLSAYNLLTASYEDIPPILELSVLIFRRIICKLLMFFIIRFLLQNSKIQDSAIPRSYSACMLIFCGFDILLMLFQIFYLSPQNSDLSSSPFATVFMTGCFLVILCFFYLFMNIVKSYRENMEYRIQNKELELHAQYLEQTKDFITSSRQFRHDIKAHIFCMEGLLDQGKYEELSEYMQQFQSSDFLNPPIRPLCSDDILNTLLNQKLKKAENLEIPLSISVSLSTDPLVRKLDLCGILSNLLDNAIEASLNMPSPKITLELKEVKGYLSILVVNHTMEDTLKQNPKLFTTKDDKQLHGLGLSIVRNIAKKYNGSVELSSSKHSFSCFVLLENSPSPVS